MLPDCPAALPVHPFLPRSRRPRQRFSEPPLGSPVTSSAVWFPTVSMLRRSPGWSISSRWSQVTIYRAPQTGSDCTAQPTAQPHRYLELPSHSGHFFPNYFSCCTVKALHNLQLKTSLRRTVQQSKSSEFMTLGKVKSLSNFASESAAETLQSWKIITGLFLTWDIRSDDRTALWET